MSHLPIKPVDYYLDKISSKHVLFVGGAAIILLFVFGPGLSNALFNLNAPQTAQAPGQHSDHYPDGVTRFATTPGDESRTDRLFSSSPYVIPPYQHNRMNSNYGGYV